MDKQERLQRAFLGEAVDHIPVALWRHWPGDDQRTADLAQSIIDFQRHYDWDFVAFTPSPTYSVIDLGIQDEWEGTPDGSRIVRRSPVRRSLDWTELRVLDPTHGELGKQLISLRMVLDAMRSDSTPVIMTVYSPLTQAARLAGSTMLLRHLRRNPDRLRTGLNALVESTLRFLEALESLEIAGVYYVIEHAHHDALSEGEYEAFGLPDDLRILDALPVSWWFNMVYLSGESPMFQCAERFPVQAVNWCDRIARPDMVESRALFRGAACGGLDAERHIQQATPSVIRDLAREAVMQMNGRRMILSAGGPVLATTPMSNLRAVREVVNSLAVS